MIRRAPAIAAAAVAVAAALAAVAWMLLAREVESRAIAWAEARRAEGYEISWRAIGVGGFPFALELRLAEPAIAKDGWSAAAPDLSATLRPWRLDRVDLAAPSLAVAGAEVAASVEQPVGALELAEGRARRLTIEGTAASALAGGTEIGRAATVRLLLDPFPSPVSGAQDEIAAGRLALGQVRPAPHLAPRLLFADPFDLDLEGSVRGPAAGGLAGWRDGGGVVDLRRLQLRWGPLRVDGDATLALDGAMRPLGAGSAKLRGLVPTLDRLVATGQIRAQDASIAKIVLGLMAKPTADGGSEATVPITAQDGKLFLGPVAVATLRPLAE